MSLIQKPFGFGVGAVYPGYSITKVVIHSPSNTSFNSSDAAQEWRLEGSHDGSEWVELTSTQTAPVGNGIDDEVTDASEITDTDQYNYHRINMNGGTSGAPGSWVLLGEVQFYQGGDKTFIDKADGTIIGNMTYSGYSCTIDAAFDGIMHNTNTTSAAAAPYNAGWDNTCGKSWGLEQSQ